MRDIYLILENNTVFKGKSFGAFKEAVGEVVFTTSMNGFVETLSDPAYYGQIVVQTFPLNGNYGVNLTDFENKKIYVKGYVTREICNTPSNFRCDKTVSEFLVKNDIPGIYGIDTRKLTKLIRDEGIMNGKLSFNPDFDKDIEKYTIIDAVSAVAENKEEDFKADKPVKNVVLYDFGDKNALLNELLKRGCNVKVVPYDTTAERINELKPDGVVLSAGPGNPQGYAEITENIKKICEYKIPILGISLGHQLLALANGAETFKLKYGHRGGNQPVTDTKTKRVYITVQNHGYCVKDGSLSDHVAETAFVNANDKTCEGVEYKNIPAFSVQFMPKTAGGPQDMGFLFEKFINLMEVNG